MSLWEYECYCGAREEYASLYADRPKTLRCPACGKDMSLAITCPTLISDTSLAPGMRQLMHSAGFPGDTREDWKKMEAAGIGITNQRDRDETERIHARKGREQKEKLSHILSGKGI